MGGTGAFFSTKKLTSHSATSIIYQGSKFWKSCHLKIPKELNDLVEKYSLRMKFLIIYMFNWSDYSV